MKHAKSKLPKNPCRKTNLDQDTLIIIVMKERRIIGLRINEPVKHDSGPTVNISLIDIQD